MGKAKTCLLGLALPPLFAALSFAESEIPYNRLYKHDIENIPENGPRDEHSDDIQ